MAINRKGMRKLIIGDETYHYKIRHSCNCFFFCDCIWGDKLTVVIEHPEGKVKTHKFSHERYKAFTPRNVAALIKEKSSETSM